MMFVVRSVRFRVKSLALACLTLVGLAVTPQSAEAAPSLIYEGQIGTSSTGDSPVNVVEQGGFWTTDPGVTLSWKITYDPVTTYWNYTYTFDRPDSGNLSHFILELTPGTTVLNSSTKNTTYGEFGADSGNPGIPGSIGYGVKFEPFPEGDPLTIRFDSFRAPTWGDFYAKDGSGGGAGDNAAWNLGFLNADPLAPAANGQLDGKILRPDTIVGPPIIDPAAVPEPASLATAGMGVLMGLGYAWRRRKRAAA